MVSCHTGSCPALPYHFTLQHILVISRPVHNWPWHTYGQRDTRGTQNNAWWRFSSWRSANESLSVASTPEFIKMCPRHPSTSALCTCLHSHTPNRQCTVCSGLLSIFSHDCRHSCKIINHFSLAKADLLCPPSLASPIPAGSDWPGV